MAIQTRSGARAEKLRKGTRMILTSLSRLPRTAPMSKPPCSHLSQKSWGMRRLFHKDSKAVFAKIPGRRHDLLNWAKIKDPEWDIPNDIHLHGIAGYTVFTKKPDHHYLDLLWVAPEYRSCGLGKTLMSRTLREISLASRPKKTPVHLLRYVLNTHRNKGMASRENDSRLKRYYQQFGFRNAPLSVSSSVPRPRRRR